MKKRLLLLPTAAIVALLGIGAAGAHDNVYTSKATSLISHCGDSWSESAVYAGALITENGVSGTRQFRVKFILQEWTGSEWVNSTSTTVTSGIFPDDSKNYSWRPTDGSGNEAFKVGATPAHQDKYIRARVQFDWLGIDGTGATFLLHRHVSPGSGFCYSGNLQPPPSQRPV